MTFLRALVYNLGFYLGTAVLAILGLPVLLMSRRAAARFSRFWTGLAFRWLRLTVGLDYEVRGREHLPAGPYLAAIKHQSAWDTLALNQIFADPAVVLKQELLSIPFFGWYLRKVGMIAVDRSQGAAALRGMIAAAKAASAEGRPVVIFPEGTRGPVGERLPYQPGVVALYQQLGVPLVPVALDSGIYWGRRAFLKRPGRIVVEILPPIPAGEDRKTILPRLEAAIEDTVARLVAAAR